MSDQFLGEIRMFGGNFAIQGWALCNGQILSITQNTALFSLLGTQYGGNGTSNFALPNLQGMFPMNQGQGTGLTNRNVGDTGGEAGVTLLTTQLPAHTHAAACVTVGGDSDDPTNNYWARAHGGKSPINAYSTTGASNVAMNTGALGSIGGNQPHNNLPPYLVLNFIIALVGIFPSRS